MKIPKNAPKKIYLQHDPDEMGGPFKADDVTWCVDPINRSDLEYVRDDLVQDAIDLLQLIGESDNFYYGREARRVLHAMYARQNADASGVEGPGDEGKDSAAAPQHFHCSTCGGYIDGKTRCNLSECPHP